MITRFYISISLYRVINAISLLASDINSGKFVADSLITERDKRRSKNSSPVAPSSSDNIIIF